jgi:predicted neutral ceramidase superfamily lipid hydrolase
MPDIILKRVKFNIRLLASSLTLARSMKEVDYFCEGIFSMDELISLSSQLHLLFVVILTGLIGGNIYLLKSDHSFVKLSKRLELLAPQYYIILAAIFFTGLIVMAVQQFTFSILVWIMIAVWLFIVAFGIRNYKIYKKARDAKIDQEHYKALTIRKYTIDLLLVIGTSLFFYTVH